MLLSRSIDINDHLSKAGAGEEVASGDNSAEASLNEGMSALLFVEMLFWKSAHDSADVRDEYKWRDLYQRDSASLICLKLPAPEISKQGQVKRQRRVTVVRQPAHQMKSKVQQSPEPETQG